MPTPEEYKKIAAKVLEDMGDKKKKKYFEKLSKKLKRKEGKYFLFRSEFERNGIVNLFDNVSEMTSKTGIAVGGNNIAFTPLEENIKADFEYSKPHQYLGFRCIAEIRE